MSFKALYPFLAASAVIHLSVATWVDHRLHLPTSDQGSMRAVPSETIRESAPYDTAEVFLERGDESPARPVRQSRRAAASAAPAPKAKTAPAAVKRSGETALPVSRDRVRSSAELLADPAVGRVFSSYFSAIKKKIHEAASNGYADSQKASGKALLIFVLRADGAIDRVSVSEQGTDTGAAGRRFALWCIERSAPFPPFPKELGLEKISFSLSILFDDLR